jgi:hypothetical protein
MGYFPVTGKNRVDPALFRDRRDFLEYFSRAKRDYRAHRGAAGSAIRQANRWYHHIMQAHYKTSMQEHRRNFKQAHTYIMELENA